MKSTDFVKAWCKAHEHEVIFRYDFIANEWMLHLYPAKKGSEGKNVLFWVKSLDIGID